MARFAGEFRQGLPVGITQPCVELSALLCFAPVQPRWTSTLRAIGFPCEGVPGRESPHDRWKRMWFRIGYFALSGLPLRIFPTLVVQTPEIVREPIIASFPLCCFRCFSPPREGVEMGFAVAVLPSCGWPFSLCCVAGVGEERTSRCGLLGKRQSGQLCFM